MNFFTTGCIMAAIFLPYGAFAAGNISGNTFNPAISLVLDGRYNSIDNSELNLAGFQLGGEAGLPNNGFSMGHNELAISANIDDKFYGSLSLAIVDEYGETTIELEEAYIETLQLGAGFNIKAGQFFSGLGYLNSIHEHAQDFSDRPLVYDALMGGHLTSTGMQARWLAPTAIYLSFGLELSSATQYPGGASEDGNSGAVVFVKTGADLGSNASWQLGLSHYRSEFDQRDAGGHAHGGHDDNAADNELLDGNVSISGIDFVTKWAPNGNSTHSYVKFQSEFFIRHEDGFSSFSEGSNSATANYDGRQQGFYAQTVYQFIPAWRVGLRYDWLKADNKLTDFIDNGILEDEYLEESKLGSNDNTPQRISIMLDWSASHFSLIRLQLNRLDDGESIDNAISLQYLMSLGSHGSHTY